MHGSSHHNAKLTEHQVAMIRTEYVRQSSAHGQYALARKYGVGQRTISKVLNFETWFHVR